MKTKKINERCSLCGEKKDKFTAILTDTNNYILCLTCYPSYDSLDNLGKKWMEGEFLTGTLRE
jgi:hypothetical protein|tara:strand:- start:456 stop:644 length:189 start_codon:yes stop_codon:yes gene_type:complete